jgi:hypothetical protein
MFMPWSINKDVQLSLTCDIPLLRVKREKGCNVPSRNIRTQRPSSKAEASSPNFASIKSGNLMIL